MRAISLTCSATLLPHHNHPHDTANRCVSLSSPTRVIKSQLSIPRRNRLRYTGKCIPGFSGLAMDSATNVQRAVVPASVPVRVVHELLQAGHHYLDVRTTEEYSEGHVVGAVNVPYMLRVGPGMARNPNFLEEVLTHFGKYDEVIVGCELGKRSLMAATELFSAGFTGVTDMSGGYAAWTQNGLPVE